jgi:hypothetical protein
MFPTMFKKLDSLHQLNNGITAEGRLFESPLSELAINRITATKECIR